MFIVIEGVDGVGKATQLNLLVKRIRKSLNKKVAVFDFPQYNKTLGGRLAGRYLAGEFGGINEVNPYLASLPYAIDRFQAKDKINKALKNNEIIIANRYTLSNMAHQSAKLPITKRNELLEFLNELEYKTFKIPKEDLNIFLYLLPKKAQAMVDKKEKRDYLGKTKRDIHENDLNHLSKASEMYKSLTKKYPKRIVMIDCTDNEGNLLNPNEIHELIWKQITPSISN